ncbi:MAG: nitroreductase [Clostridia bacterium]|nr:nitroreductase [Clostridia bacterium]
MEFYNQIFKRKSFHLFRYANPTPMPLETLAEIQTFLKEVKPLDSSIKTSMVIVPEGDTSCHCGGEYCILFYSEEKGNYLRNIGYIGEQIDLFCASKNVGALWYGIGKPKKDVVDGLSFVIMISIACVPEESFRKDMFKAKRKDLSEIWQGDTLKVGEIVRFTPSACNSQPWRVENTGTELRVFRFRKPGRIGILSPAKAFYFNRIDMGIFLYMLEECLGHENIGFERTLFEDGNDEEKVLIATYQIKG